VPDPVNIDDLPPKAKLIAAAVDVLGPNRMDVAYQKWILEHHGDTVSRPTLTRYFRRLGIRRSKAVDWTGKRINFLEVLGHHHTDADGVVWWTCVCHYQECGRIKVIRSQMLSRGQESCGCKAAEETRERSLNKYKGEYS
jgi:hypothetical protein